MANWDNFKGLLDHTHTTDEIVGLNLIASGLDFKGTYNPLTTYEEAQYVQYNGSVYVCKLETIGNLPTDTTYWNLFISKGDSGDSGKIPYDIAVAQYAVGLLTIPSKHDPLQVRINNIVPLEYKAYLTDFGYNGVSYDTPSPWNNIRGNNGASANGAFVENLRATDYSSSTIKITIGENLLFSQTGVSVTGNDSGAYPDKAIRDCIETASNTEGLLTISGLSPGVQYKFKIHGGRQYLTATSQYTIKVAESVDTTVLTLNTYNNITNTVETPYLTAGVSGIITIKVRSTTTVKGYLNVLEIREKL